MRYWGELKSLRGQSVGEVGLVMRAVFRICGKESQTGLQRVEKLATPLVRASSLLFMMRPRLQDWMADFVIIFAILAIVIVRFCGSKISCLLPGALTWTSLPPLYLRTNILGVYACTNYATEEIHPNLGKYRFFVSISSSPFYFMTSVYC